MFIVQNSLYAVSLTHVLDEFRAPEKTKLSTKRLAKTGGLKIQRNWLWEIFQVKEKEA